MITATMLPDPGEALGAEPCPDSSTKAAEDAFPDPDFGALHSATEPGDAQKYLRIQAQAYTAGAQTQLEAQKPVLQGRVEDTAREERATKEQLEATSPTLAGAHGAPTARWPDSRLDRFLLVAFLLAGLTLTGLGWWNSAHICLIFLQNTALSFGFTAPLLFLPFAAHLVARDLRVRRKWLAAVLGLMALSGAYLLIGELGGATRSHGDILADSSGPNALRLLLGQVLLEIASGVLLIAQAEKRLRHEPAAVPNPDYEPVKAKAAAAADRHRAATAELARVQAQLDGLKARADAWVQGHFLKWQSRRTL